MQTSYIGTQPSVGGVVVQEDMFQTGAVATGTTVIPFDDTIPQITEGDEYMSLSFTPTDANNWLDIDVVVNVAHSSAQMYMQALLFKDSNVDCLAVGLGAKDINVDSLSQVKISHRILAGSVLAQVFSIRVGTATVGTTTFNGQSGAALYGGTLASSIRIREVSPNRIAPTGEIITPAIGVGQTWQDVKASRAIGTLYTNSTGKSIQVSVSANNNTATGYFTIQVDGLDVYISNGAGGVGFLCGASSVIVPSGSTYKFIATLGVSTLFRWAELR